MDKTNTLRTVGWPLFFTGSIGCLLVRNDNLGKAFATIGLAGGILVSWSFIRELPVIISEQKGGVTYEVD